MARTSRFLSLVFALLVFSVSQELFVSAQVGTVQNTLFDYIMNMNKNSQQPPPTDPPPSSSGTQPQTLNTAGANTGTGSSGSGPSPFDLYGQMMQESQQTTPRTISSAGGSSGSSYMDILSQMSAASQTQQPQSQPQQSTPGGGSASSPLDPTSLFNQVAGGSQPQGGSSSSGGSNPLSFYNQLIQTMGQSPTQTGAPQSQMIPFPDPFPTTQAPPTPKPTPKILPFVPPEWNQTTSNSQQGHSGWGSRPNHMTGWGHNTVHRSSTGWQHHDPHRRPHSQRSQRPHPMSGVTMMPRFREMINKQATQFGDLAYYQQHGCIDPTPKTPGPGGIRPTQTLWYGCDSPVSKMVCMRVGKQATGRSSTMAMMMSMMNPAMTRMFEKCLTPKMMTQMMFQGLSGGAGGMNPMLMMAMSGGGGGGMAGVMPMVMMMMNQQNQAGGGAGASTSTPMSFGPSPAKQTYPDPSQANTLISQAAMIPHGAAQPAAQGPSNSLMNAFGSMLGLGGSQTPASPNLPSGAAAPGTGPSPGHALNPGAGGQNDCSSLMPLMMSKMMAAGEGLNSPEAMEAIGEMRKQFLPYSCQELRIKYTGLPLRMCCPGRVDQPTIFDLFKAKNAGGA